MSAVAKRATPLRWDAVENHAKLLKTLQRLFDAPLADLGVALTHAADVIADALAADKVDAFLHDKSRESLAAAGTSTQALSAQQKKLGLDVLPIANGGRAAYVFQTGQVYRTGDLQNDPDELRGMKEQLKICSQIGIPLDVGGERRGMVMIASQKPDHFTEADEAFARGVVRWVGIIAHRAELIQQMERNALEQGRQAAAEELVTVLAHDLRNHLSPLALRLYSLQQRAAADQRNNDLDDVSVALQSVSRISHLISDLLDVARIDKGLFHLDLEPADLTQLAHDAAGMLARREHEIHINATGPMIAWADAGRLRQCLENLMTNAINHSPAGAPVHVSVSEVQRESGQWARIEIRDEGPGIPDEIKPHLFERFHTGGKQRGGLGLGLYLAKRIANAHGGDVETELTRGTGARFIITLPRYRPGD